MTLGIISAMPEELTHLLQDTEHTTTEIGGIPFYRAEIESVKSVLVKSGIGKTNSAMVTTILCHQFGCEKIVFSGVAGGIDESLKIGDIVISTDAICVDYGRFQGGKFTTYQPGNDPFEGADTTHGYTINPDLKKIISIPNTDGLKQVQGHTPKIVWGKVLTADTYLHCANKRQQYWHTYNAQAYAMEGASVAQVCEQFNTPWVIVRALSDLSGDDSSLDFNKFLTLTTYNASVVTRHIVRCIRDNT